MRVATICILLIASLASVPVAAADSVVYPDCSPAPPADVVLVVDRSGSMGPDGNGGGGLIDAQLASSNLIARLRTTDHSALVSFAHDQALDKTLDNDHPATDAAVQSLVATGGTDIGSALDLAHTEFTNNGRATAAPFLVLLTDGVSVQTPDPVTEAAQAKADGITVYAVGLGSNVDTAQLQAIASGPNTYFNPQNGNDLDVAFQAIADDVLGLQDATADAHDLFVEVVEPRIPGAARVDRLHHVVAPDDAYDETLSFHVSEAGLDITGRLAWAEARTESEATRAAAHGAAAIHDLRIEVLGAPFLSADVVTAFADADARTGSATATTDGDIVGLVVDGTPYDVVPKDLATPLGTVRFLVDATATTSDMAEAQMEAIRVDLLLPTGESVEVVVSHAYAGAYCGHGDLTPPAPPTDDPVLPTCLLGTPVEVPVGPVDVVEVDLCSPCAPDAPRVPPTDRVLPPVVAPAAAVPGTPKGPIDGDCEPTCTPPPAELVALPRGCEVDPGQPPVQPPCDVEVGALNLADVADCVGAPCDPADPLEDCLPTHPCDLDIVYTVACDPVAVCVDEPVHCVPVACYSVPAGSVQEYCWVSKCPNALFYQGSADPAVVAQQFTRDMVDCVRSLEISAP